MSAWVQGFFVKEGEIFFYPSNSPSKQGPLIGEQSFSTEKIDL